MEEEEEEEGQGQGGYARASTTESLAPPALCRGPGELVLPSPH